MLYHLRILSVPVLIVLSTSVAAKCLPQPDANPACRYPQGDSWCAEKDQANPYAYSDKCLSNGATIVPNPASECDANYGNTLKKAGLAPKEISIHGPEDDDFNGYGCPYRITPAPGTEVRPGTTVTFRSAWEAG